MGFIVNSLPDYVNQENKELITKVVFGAPTVRHINLMTGVKYKTALNILQAEPVLQERVCGFDDNGITTFTQKIMEVGAYKVNESLCEEDLRQKWMNSEVVSRAGAEVLPFEEQITKEIVDKVINQVEKLIWQADKTNNNDLFDGLLTQIVASASAIDADSQAATVWGRVQDVYAQIPADIIPNAAIFMGLDTFRSLCMELAQANLYHYEVNPAANEIILPGTNNRVIAVSGLNGTGAIVASDPKNFYYGVDMIDDLEQFKLWYSDDNQEFRLAIKFNAGAAIAFDDLVVYDV